MSDLLQALVESGIPATRAARLEAAIRSTVRDEQSSIFTAKTTDAQYFAPGSRDSFALYASGPAVQEGDTFGRGKAALGVAGLAFVNGQLSVTGDARVDNLVSKSRVACRVLAAEGIGSSSMSVQNSLSATKDGVSISVPLTVSRGIVSEAGGQFSGRNVFDGQTVLTKVHWNGDRDPAVVTVPARFVTSGSSVSVQTQTVAVLNDYGAGVSQKLSAALSANSGHVSVSGGSVSLTGSAVSVATGVSSQTFSGSSGSVELTGGTISLDGSEVTVVTNVVFDPAECAFTLTTAKIFNCTGATLSGLKATGGPFILSSPNPTITVKLETTPVFNATGGSVSGVSASGGPFILADPWPGVTLAAS